MRKCSKCKQLKNENDFYLRRESWCKDCKKSYVASFQKKNHAQTNINKKMYAQRSPGKVSLAKAKYRESNRELLRIKNSDYQKANKKSVLANCRKYQVQKIQASPSWMTKEHFKEIKRFYENCPEGHHVDHIVPLRGKHVCGLHLPWNLQYLIAWENFRKSNKS